MGSLPAKAETDPEGTVLAAKRSMAEHVSAMLAFSEMGIPTFDYGNNIRQMAKRWASATPLISRICPSLYSSVVLSRYRSVPLVALSGDPEDIYKTDAKVKEIVADDEHPHHWLDMARERINFGLAGAYLLGWAGVAAKAGSGF